MPVYEIDGKEYIVERVFEKKANKTFLEILYEYFSIPGIIEREAIKDDESNEQKSGDNI